MSTIDVRRSIQSIAVPFDDDDVGHEFGQSFSSDTANDHDNNSLM
jgi:hypothetical protein